MAQFPALNLWTDAWLADTGHLGRVERDLYMHLLILIWRTPGCRVPNDIEWITRRLRCLESEVVIVRDLVSEFCQNDGNWITQKRLSKEFQLAAKRGRAASDNAKSRWEKEKDLCDRNATTTTTITTNTFPPIAPQRGAGVVDGVANGRRRKGYSTRESLAQALEYIEARRDGRGEESCADDPVLLPGLRQGTA